MSEEKKPQENNGKDKNSKTRGSGWNYGHDSGSGYKGRGGFGSEPGRGQSAVGNDPLKRLVDEEYIRNQQGLSKPIDDINLAEELCDKAKLALDRGDYVEGGILTVSAMVIYEKHNLLDYYDMVKQMLFSRFELRVAQEARALAEEKTIPWNAETAEKLVPYTETHSKVMERLHAEREDLLRKRFDLEKKIST